MKNLFLFFFLSLTITTTSQTNLEWLSYYGVQKQELSGTKPLAACYDSTYHFIYVAGITNDTMGIATPGAHQQVLYNAGGVLGLTSDVFLCKWDTLGNLIWGTYLGGEGTDIVTDMAVDNQGCVLIFGNTTSTFNISTSGAFQESPVAPADSDLPNNFLSKFSADGVMLWSTYFGAGNLGGYSGLTLNPSNNDIYLCASSFLPGLGTTGTFQPNFYGGISDGILAKFNSSGSRIWSTHIGGEGYDDLTNLTLSAQGFLYICGTTKSLTNIASPGAALGTRDPDTNKLLGFLAKFDTLGQRVWCTYLGGDSTTDRYLDIKTTSNNTTGQENIFIYGRVRSTNLGTVGTFGQGYNGGLYDMVLLKYNESGQKQWGSYIGGSQDEFSFVPAHSGIFGFSNSMVVSQEYNKEEIQIAGGTSSADFYFDIDCSYTPHTGNNKGFVVALDYTGNLIWSRPFDEGINNINPIGPYVYFVSGHTAIDDLATVGAYKETKATGSVSGFVGKLNFNPCLPTEFTIYRIDDKLYAPNGFANYQWFKNGLSIEGTHTDTLDISDSEPAVFTVSFEGDCICVYLSAEFNTDPSSVYPSASKNSLATLYPNPAFDYIYLSQLPQCLSISIYNQLGQKVCDHCTIDGNYRIDISTLLNGNYVLHLISKEGVQFYFKFTKLKGA